MAASIAITSPMLRDLQDDWPGVYTPAEVAGYLRATTPLQLQRQRVASVRRIQRWVRREVVAPQRRGHTERDLFIDFEDLVTCRAVTLLRAAGFSLRRIYEAEQHFSRVYDVSKPFAHHDFWYGRPRIYGRLQAGLLVSDNGQLAWEFVAEWLTPLRSGLGFSSTGRANHWEPIEGVTLRPTVQFGQPCLKGTRIPTSALWSYVAGGDSPQFVADAYDIQVTDVERACAWENRVRAALQD